MTFTIRCAIAINSYWYTPRRPRNEVRVGVCEMFGRIRRRDNTVPIILLMLVLFCSIYVIFKVPSNAPFKSKTVCWASRSTSYELLTGVFNWQTTIEPKRGYFIQDGLTVHHVGSRIEMKRGMQYPVFKEGSGTRIAVIHPI